MSLLVNRYTREAVKLRLARECVHFPIAETALGLNPDYPVGVLFAGAHLRQVLSSFSGRRFVDRRPCVKTCNQIQWGVWCLRIQGNGVRIATLRCLACGLEMATKGANDEQMPVWADLLNGDPCERCGSVNGTELHHWAPRHLFDDADDWPMAYLCPTCHREWHRLVTPHMHRKQVST